MKGAIKSRPTKSKMDNDLSLLALRAVGFLDYLYKLKPQYSSNIKLGLIDGPISK